MFGFLSPKILVFLSLFGFGPSFDTLQEMKPLAGYKICIDAGHGGQECDHPKYNPQAYTGGAFGICTGQTEGDVNLRVSCELEKYLQAMGARTIMTRRDRARITAGTDSASELDIRPAIAENNQCDFFVSIHHNSGPSHVNYGTTFYNAAGGQRSISLAKHIAREQESLMGVPSVGAHDGNVYRVLKHCDIPAVLVEASFMTYPNEDYRLYNFNYNRTEAYAIARGIALQALEEKHFPLKAKLAGFMKSWVEPDKNTSAQKAKHTRKPAHKPAKKTKRSKKGR